MFSEFIDQILQKISTLSGGSPESEASREILTGESREMKSNKPISDALCCPDCTSKDFVRRGWRQKERERVQLYQCKACGKTFTPRAVKGKHYPLKTIMEAMSLYNLGYSLEKACEAVNGTTKVADSKEISNTGIGASTLSAWLTEFEGLCRFGPLMREYATKML